MKFNVSFFHTVVIYMKVKAITVTQVKIIITILPYKAEMDHTLKHELPEQASH